MMSCTHGHVVRCANLFKGETYKHTHDMHLESSRLGAKFFVTMSYANTGLLLLMFPTNFLNFLHSAMQ